MLQYDGFRAGATDSKKDREASIKRNFQLAPTGE